jgi:hypothetical protein
MPELKFDSDSVVFAIAPALEQAVLTNKTYIMVDPGGQTP